MAARRASVPLSVRFAQITPPLDEALFRYDDSRQVSQVLVDGIWHDAADCPGESPWRTTRETKMKAETTDDR